MSTWRPASRELLAALLVFALATAALAIVHRHATPRYRLGPRAAVAAARADALDAQLLAHRHVTSARTIPYDGRMQAVNFFDGPQLVLYAVVDPHGHVRARQGHRGYMPQLGAPVANSWWLLALLTAVFLLAVMVVPLRRIRNLDALALAGFTLNVAAVNAGLVELSVIVGVLLLAYLGLRCLIVGMRAQASTVPSPQTPLLDWLTTRWERPRRLRLLWLLTGALLAAFLMVTLTSDNESTVAAASLAGGTDLLHWQLPYGHITNTLHGDTYPLLNYVFYLPGALLSPISTPWSDLSGSLAIAAAGALATAAAIWLLARRSLGAGRSASVRAVLAWLAFPPVLLAASGGTNDLVVAACLAWMLVLAASASGSLLLLAIAVWTKVVPLVLAPLWLVRGEHARLRVLVPAAVLSVLLCGYLVALGGIGAPGAMLRDISFPFHRGSLYAPWYALSVPWLQPVAQAGVLALLLWVVLRLRRSPSVWRQPARLAGVCGALLIGVQLSANQWTYTYLPWVFPFIALALLVDVPRPRQVQAAPSVAIAADAPQPATRPELQPV
jgi:hypothetical protein